MPRYDAAYFDLILLSVAEVLARRDGACDLIGNADQRDTFAKIMAREVAEAVKEARRDTGGDAHGH